MLPGNALSTITAPAQLIEPVNAAATPLIDVGMGGIGLADASVGLLYQLWTLRYEAPDVVVSAPEVPDTVLFSRAGITELALAFDQNMRAFVAFVQDGQARFWWYDSNLSAQTFTDLPADAKNPRSCMDEKRAALRSDSDIILAYTRGTGLYYRQQRERFQTERLLADPCGGKLVSIGMSKALRLQFKLRPSDY